MTTMIHNLDRAPPIGPRRAILEECVCIASASHSTLGATTQPTAKLKSLTGSPLRFRIAEWRLYMTWAHPEFDISRRGTSLAEKTHKDLMRQKTGIIYVIVPTYLKRSASLIVRSTPAEHHRLDETRLVQTDKSLHRLKRGTQSSIRLVIHRARAGVANETLTHAGTFVSRAALLVVTATQSQVGQLPCAFVVTFAVVKRLLTSTI